jgi:hypothetical protein
VCTSRLILALNSATADGATLGIPMSDATNTWVCGTACSIDLIKCL